MISSRITDIVHHHQLDSPYPLQPDIFSHASTTNQISDSQLFPSSPINANSASSLTPTTSIHRNRSINESPRQHCISYHDDSDAISYTSQMTIQPTGSPLFTQSPLKLHAEYSTICGDIAKGKMDHDGSSLTMTSKSDGILINSNSHHQSERLRRYSIDIVTNTTLRNRSPGRHTLGRCASVNLGSMSRDRNSETVQMNLTKAIDDGSGRIKASKTERKELSYVQTIYSKNKNGVLLIRSDSKRRLNVPIGRQSRSHSPQRRRHNCNDRGSLQSAQQHPYYPHHHHTFTPSHHDGHHDDDDYNNLDSQSVASSSLSSYNTTLQPPSSTAHLNATSPRQTRHNGKDVDLIDSNHDEAVFVVEDIHPQITEALMINVSPTQLLESTNDNSERPVSPLRDSATRKTDEQCNGDQSRSTVLIFVYGTLKRGYCNHYNLETDGITYFQDSITVHPYVMYLDSSNRSRPCLTDGSSCPINELIYNTTRRQQLIKSYEKNEDEQSIIQNSDKVNVRQTSAHGHHTNNDISDSITSVNNQIIRSPRCDERLVCPFCCFRREQQQHSINNDETIIPSHQQYKSLAPPQSTSYNESQSTVPLSVPRMFSSKPWGLPVRGELYRIDASLLPALDRFERVPSHYVRQTITVRGVDDEEYYHAEVYFNNTTSERWCELLGGRFRLLRDYTMDHHRLYQPRDGNDVARQRKSTHTFKYYPDYKVDQKGCRSSTSWSPKQ